MNNVNSRIEHADANQLAALKVAELQSIASELSLSGVRKMRKNELVEAILEARSQKGSSNSSRGRKTSKTLENSKTNAASDAQKPSEKTSSTQNQRSSGVNAKKASEAIKGKQPQQSEQQLPNEARTNASARQTRRRASLPEMSSLPAAGHANAGQTGFEKALPEVDALLDSALASREQAARKAQRERDLRLQQQRDETKHSRAQNDLDKLLDPEEGSKKEAPSEKETEPQHSRTQRTRSRSRNRNTFERQDDKKQNGQQGRSNDDSDRLSNARYRKRRNDDGEVEIQEDDVLLPVAGVLDILENYAFVRTSGYLPGTSDVYVSLGQVKKYSLRKGDAIVGAIKQPREGDFAGRQKYNALVKIETINGLSVEENQDRIDFAKLTPLYPESPLKLEQESTDLTSRVVDLVAPLGKGQRGLIVAPPRSGKTTLLQTIASSIRKNNPEVHLMILLVDERPEDVTAMQRTVRGEVISSTFDRPAEDHITVAELALERAKRLVELGHDVVLLLDSITRLTRAYSMISSLVKPLHPGFELAEMHPVKRFFGAARNIEHGGSLTILASALVQNGSDIDEAIFAELRNTANMEVHLSRNLADQRLFPAVDVCVSHTRQEELFLDEHVARDLASLHAVCVGVDPSLALEEMLKRIKKTSNNAELLTQLQKIPFEV